MASDTNKPIPPDPFTKCGRAVCEAIVGWTPFKSRVNPSNLVSAWRWENALGGEFGQVREVNTPSSLPELLLTQRGFTLNPSGPNSMAVGFSQTVVLQIATGDLDPRMSNWLRWHGFRAVFTHWHKGLFPPFVSDWQIQNPNEATTDDIINRGAPGWASVFEVLMIGSLPRSEIINPTLE